MSLLQFKNISKAYQLGPNSPKRTVLDQVNFQLNESDSIAITGPSGSGKSTLLNIMGSMDKADSGSIIFQDQDISTMKEDQLAQIRNKHIGFIFQ